MNKKYRRLAIFGAGGHGLVASEVAILNDFAFYHFDDEPEAGAGIIGCKRDGKD